MNEMESQRPPTPVTILTGFLGSGKTTVILNLIPQLPPTYKLALLKNEFGDLAVDSQLAAAKSISGVRELTGGCICCNLVGQLGDALETLRSDIQPDRIIIETSGSAFPATLAMEVNRLARESNGENFVLDGVVSVIDVENWQGYDDTSVTAKLQAQYTDLVIFNKWELVDERRFDVCLDRLGDLEISTPWVKSDRGTVSKDVILGIDGALAKEMKSGGEPLEHKHDHGHHSEVEVLSIIMDAGPLRRVGVDLDELEHLLLSAPKDEIYRIKAIFYASKPPTASSGNEAAADVHAPGKLSRYLLNWAFGRWTFTPVSLVEDTNGPTDGLLTPQPEPGQHPRAARKSEPVLRMTIVSARYESNKWKKRIESGQLLVLEGGNEDAIVKVERLT